MRVVLAEKRRRAERNAAAILLSTAERDLLPSVERAHSLPISKLWLPARPRISTVLKGAMQRGVVRYSSHIRIVHTYRRILVLGTRYGTTVDMDGRCCFSLFSGPRTCFAAKFLHACGRACAGVLRELCMCRTPRDRRADGCRHPCTDHDPASRHSPYRWELSVTETAAMRTVRDRTCRMGNLWYGSCSSASFHPWRTLGLVENVRVATMKKRSKWILSGARKDKKKI